MGKRGHKFLKCINQGPCVKVLYSFNLSNMLKLNTNRKDRVFFTADQHFLHSNVLKFSGRPFQSIEEHDDKLIENLNSIVRQHDNLFILGDFIFTSNVDIINAYYLRLNGVKHLILGNHCIRNRMDREVIRNIFEGRVYDTLTLSINKDIYYLSHFPYQFFGGGINLHGHIHSGPTSNASEKIVGRKDQYDVGVDNNNYFPISLEQINIKLNPLQHSFTIK